MQYRTGPKPGNALSILGYGCMRFPRSLGQIDMGKTEKLILSAVDRGVNYFDTAYVYGGSEEALGTIIHKNSLRDRIFLATKLPHTKCRTYEDFDRIFSEQLQRLHTDYIDYYLIHNLSDLKSWERVRALGLEKWIADQKAAGKIRQIGFSFHGSPEDFGTLLDGFDWDFCQIQYNYMNTHYQAGTAGLQRAAAKGLMVVVMEPLLGGKLAVGLPDKAVKLFRAENAAASPAVWALRWLWDQKEVTVVLSGMNDFSQLDENIKTADTSAPGMLTDRERKTLASVTEAIRGSYKVPCTGCNYCMPCPQGINIPACFAAYNNSYALGFVAGVTSYITSTGLTNPNGTHSPSACVKCGKCERSCPQHIAIPKMLEDVKKRMEPLWLRGVLRIVTKVMK